MATGTVKWFNNKKVMASSLRMRADRTFSFTFLLYKKAGLRSLEEGAKISYELLSERGKTVAGNLKLA